MTYTFLLVHDSLNTTTTQETFPQNSEANALEFLQNLDEIFSRYYMHSNIYNILKSSTVLCCIT